MQLTHKDQIRVLLQNDRRWSVYALGDLAPHMYDKCQWFTPDLTLVLRDYGTSILFAMGTASIGEALTHATSPVHLQVQQDGLEEASRHATLSNVKHMWRMAWIGGATTTSARAIRLTGSDVHALEQLFADGASSGESPDFFYASMVTDGVFFGIYEGAELIAAAGTHLVARDEGAAAIGNVYVRRDRRHHGLGRMVTASVVHELRELETIGLNVRGNNAAAIRVYESLGFVKHCEFLEALATR